MGGMVASGSADVAIYNLVKYQTRRPTGDGVIVGLWAYTSGSTAWNLIDEETAADGDYITSPITGKPSYCFTFAPFTIPEGAIEISVTVALRLDDTGGTNSIKAALKVAGVLYPHSTGVNISHTPTNYTWDIPLNPHTGLAWTVADVNGGGPTPLEQFGIYCYDPLPGASLTQAVLIVKYSEPAGNNSASWVSSGGVVFGGSASLSSQYCQTASVEAVGGSVFGGAATTGPGVSWSSLGGGIFGGLAEISASGVQALSWPGTGGMVAGGFAPCSAGRVSIGNGGLVAGGLSPVRAGVVVGGLGGVVFGGTASHSSQYCQTASVAAVGGSVFGGAATTGYGVSWTSLGGGIFGGLAEISASGVQALSWPGTGGMVAGGFAPCSAGRVSIGNGGLVAGGLSPVRAGVVVGGLGGGVVFGGTASLSSQYCQTASVAAVGGSVFGGAATTGYGVSWTSSGGGVFGGLAEVFLSACQSAQAEGMGGVVFSGSSLVGTASVGTLRIEAGKEAFHFMAADAAFHLTAKAAPFSDTARDVNFAIIAKDATWNLSATRQ